MSESISQTSLTNEPTDEFIAWQKWEHPTNRLKLQEALQAARHNITRYDMNNTWVSSKEMRQRMQERGVNVKTRTALRLPDEQTSKQNHFIDSN
jgi:hypothetical protein